MNAAHRVLVSALLLLAPRLWAAETGPRDCFWLWQADPTVLNVAYPDFAAQYWISAFALPPGAELEIRGEYPHARYMSFNLYDAGAAQVDGLADVLIRPEPGSSNPFLSHARRDLPDRRYRLRVKSAVPAEPREQNVLYLTLDGTLTLQPLTGSLSPSPLGLMLYRIYLPDRGRNLSGDVRLPDIAVLLAGGQRVEGADACQLLGTPIPDLLLPLLHRLTPPPLPMATANVSDPLSWQKFTNIVESLGISLPEQTRVFVPQNGGFFSNTDNAYVRSAWDTANGDLVMLHGRAPSYPDTRPGVGTMPDAEMRYWSICQNEVPTTRAVSCLADDQIPVRDDGNYIVVVSGQATRPRNATPECGVAWMASGPNPRGFLLLRNMLPRADFAQSVQAVSDYTDPGATMGPYLPVGKHMSTEAFESLGCPVSSAAVTGYLQSQGIEVTATPAESGSLGSALLLVLGLLVRAGRDRRQPSG